jgi:hypothetical protein
MGEGDCFEVAFKLVWDSDDESLLLCHGMVERYTDGLRHGHAWVERTDTITFPSDPPITTHMDVCIDKANGNDVTLPRAFYYKAGNIHEHEVVRYTKLDAARQAVRSMHFGPWHE